MRQTKTPIAELAYGKNSSLICSEWNIDSFDQCSVELAKQSAGRIIRNSRARRTALSHESSVNNLIYKIQNRKCNMIH